MSVKSHSPGGSGEASEGDRLVDAVVDVLLDGADVGLREETRAEDLVAEQGDRIPELFALDFFFRTVDGARRIAHRVATVAVGVGFDQRGDLLLPGPSDGAADGLADRQDVHAVDLLARNSVGLA